MNATFPWAGTLNGRPLPWSTNNPPIWRGAKRRLTDTQKREIVQLRHSGVLLREIAADYGISTSHVHRIVSQIGGTPGG